MAAVEHRGAGERKKRRSSILKMPTFSPVCEKNFLHGEADPSRKRTALESVDPNSTASRGKGAKKRVRKSMGRRVSFASNMEDIREFQADHLELESEPLKITKRRSLGNSGDTSEFPPVPPVPIEDNSKPSDFPPVPTLPGCAMAAPIALPLQGSSAIDVTTCVNAQHVLESSKAADCGIAAGMKPTRREDGVLFDVTVDAPRLVSDTVPGSTMDEMEMTTCVGSGIVRSDADAHISSDRRKSVGMEMTTCVDAMLEASPQPVTAPSSDRRKSVGMEMTTCVDVMLGDAPRTQASSQNCDMEMTEDVGGMIVKSSDTDPFATDVEMEFTAAGPQPGHSNNPTALHESTAQTTNHSLTTTRCQHNVAMQKIIGASVGLHEYSTPVGVDMEPTTGAKEMLGRTTNMNSSVPVTATGLAEVPAPQSVSDDSHGAGTEPVNNISRSVEEPSDMSWPQQSDEDSFLNSRPSSTEEAVGQTVETSCGFMKTGGVTMSPHNNAAFGELLFRANVRFLDKVTSKRRTTMLGPVFPQPETMADFCRVGTCLMPQLQLYEWGCNYLVGITEDLKSEIATREQHVGNHNPPIFRALMRSNGAEEQVLQAELAQVKSASRHVAKQRWHHWRHKLESRVQEALQEEAIAVQADLQGLSAIRDLLVSQNAIGDEADNDFERSRQQLEGQLIPEADVSILRSTLTLCKEEQEEASKLQTDRTDLENTERHMQEDIKTLRASLETIRGESFSMMAEIASLDQCATSENLMKEQRSYDAVCTMLPFSVPIITPNTLSIDFGSVRLTVHMTDESAESRVTRTSIDLADGIVFKSLWKRILVPNLQFSREIPEGVRSFAKAIKAVEQVQDQLTQIELLHDIQFDQQDDGILEISISFICYRKRMKFTAVFSDVWTDHTSSPSMDLKGTIDETVEEKVRALATQCSVRATFLRDFTELVRHYLFTENPPSM